MQGRYVKVNIYTNWGDGSWVTPTSIHVCGSDGVKFNDATMAHTGTSPGGGGALENCSNASTGDYWQPAINAFPWWQVDLGASQDIRKIKLQVLPGYPDRMIKDFAVSISSDGTTFTEVHRGQAAHDETEQTIEINQNSLGAEYLVDGTASHVGGYEVASKGFDKNQSTYSQNQNSCPYWIKYDLGAGISQIPGAYSIQLSSYGATYCPSEWRVWGSATGTDCSVGNEAANGWTLLDYRAGITWTSQYETKTFRVIPTTTAYRYIRWSLIAPNAPICIAEYKAYLAPSLVPVADLVNYLGTRGRDRMRTKGVSLGEKVVADLNTSFLISPRDRLRVRGVSLEQAKPGVNPFNLGMIPGIMAWYAADLIAGKSDGDAISQWDDSSGNSKHMLQVSGTRQPLYKTGIVNGLPAILFDTTNDVMATAASISGICSVVAFAKYVGATFNNYRGLFTGDSGSIWFIGNSGSAN